MELNQDYLQWGSERLAKKFIRSREMAAEQARQLNGSPDTAYRRAQEWVGIMLPMAEELITRSVNGDVEATLVVKMQSLEKYVADNQSA